MSKTRLPYISPDIIAQYHGHVSQSSSVATSKRRMSSLRRFADWAEKEGHIEENPFQQGTPLSPVVNEKVEGKRKTYSHSRREALKNLLRVGLVAGMAVLIFLLIRSVRLPIPFIPAPAREGDELVRLSPSPSPQPTQPTFDTNAIIAQIKEELVTQIGGVLEWASFENGNLLIGGSPVSSITLQTGDTTDGDIEINPDGDGIVHFLFEGTGQNFLNAQAPNLTSGSLFYGVVANNSTGYDLLRLQSGSVPTTRFSVDATGDTFVAGLVDSYGGFYTSGIERLTDSGALTNITGYSQTSGNFSINQGAGDTATISKTNTTALSDLMVLTLDERPKPENANSSYSTLVLRRYDGAPEAAALYVDVGNAIFDEQILLGRYATNPVSGIGEGSIIYNTVDDTVYAWDGSAWITISGSSSFADITSGTNTQATMVVGTGASLDFTGTGTINASSLNSLTSGQFLRSDTSDNFTSGTLTTDAGTTLDINGDLVVSDANVVFDAANTTFTFTGDLTLDPGGSDVLVDGDLILSDTFTLQVGGLTGTTYNAFANAGDAPDEAAISSDNDLYIGGDLEVDGIIYGTLSGAAGSVAWDDITSPDSNLSLPMSTFTTTFSWDSTGNADLFTFSYDNAGGTAGTDRVLVLSNAVSDNTAGDLTTEALLVLDQADTTTTGNTALTDGLLITNSGGSTFTNAITVGSGSQAIGTALNIASTGVTTDIRLQNGETIDNNTDGTVLVTSPTTSLTGDLVVQGGDVSTTSTTFNIAVANTGTINFTDTTNTLVAIKDQGVYPFLNLAGKTDTADPATCAEGDVYYNAFDDTIKICHTGNTWEALDGGGGSSVWSDLTDPTADLTLAMGVFNTTFNWDPGADNVETSLTLTIQGEDTTGTGDQDQVLLALVQTNNGVDVDQAADALLTFANNDLNDPVVNAIRFDAGAAGTDFTYGINFDAATFGTAEIILSNAETISNLVDGTVDFGATTLASSATTVNFASAALTVSSCTGCGGAAATLQSAYDAGNTITTTTGRDIEITLADLATDTTFEITQAGTALAFRVNDDGTFTDTTAFVVDQDGNVGVGNSSPTTALHVGTNTETHSLSTGDVLVSSDIELDGVLYLDGGTISNVIGTGTILFTSTPTTTENILSASSWLVENTANVGKAALMVNQTKAGDIFAASASGTTRFVIANNGTVTITTTNAATTASLVVNDSSGTGTGKIDVGTVDPPYTINGNKYATYLSAMIGVKEEVVGQITTNEYIPGVGYRYVVDFNTLSEGSDLWLFGKTTNIKENISQLVALLTPSTSTRTWYEVDEENTKLAIYSARPTDISFRLTAPRFDSEKWANTRDNTSEVTGFILNDPDTVNTNPFVATVYGFSDFVLEKIGDGFYVLKDSSGNAVDGLEAAGNFIAANIKAGAIEVKDITSDQLTVFTARVDDLLINNGLVSPVVQTALISPLPDETDVAVQIGKEGTDEGEFSVQNAQGEEVASIDTQGNASVSGDLRAKRIYADEIIGGSPGATLEEIEELLKQAEEDQALMAQSENWSISTATDSANLDSLAVNSLFVTGGAAVNSLSVTESIAVGADFVLTGNSIDTLSAPLSLQSLALAPVEIMAGKILIDTNGDVTITGNLFVAGQIESQGLSLQSPDSGFGNLLTLKDALGNEVGIIDASGSARFASVETGRLIVAGAGEGELSLNAQGEIETNATAGVATIVSGQEEIVIRNPSITDQTLVYITPTSSTQNRVLFVKSKGEGYFIAGFTDPLNTEVDFNWWVIDVGN